MLISISLENLGGVSHQFAQVLYNGPLVANWCPVALHLAKFIEAEVMLLSALPLLSVDTPPKILQRLVDASRHLEVCAKGGQKMPWV